MRLPFALMVANASAKYALSDGGLTDVNECVCPMRHTRGFATSSSMNTWLSIHEWLDPAGGFFEPYVETRTHPGAPTALPEKCSPMSVLVPNGIDTSSVSTPVVRSAIAT